MQRELPARFKGFFTVTCRNPDGSIAWEEKLVPNGTTTVGLNAILDIMFHGTTQVTTWYAGLIDNASFSALSAGDTMSSHAGWIENVDYDEAVRQTWSEGAASGGVTTGSVGTFTMNATKTIKGLFITSVSTKSGTTGTLWCTAAFGSNQSVTSGQTITSTYTCTATGG